MDLHTWITERVDAAYAAANASLIGHSIAFAPNDGSRIVSGTITNVEQGPNGTEYTFTGYEPPSTNPAPFDQATAAVRRSEADRRILARHTLDLDVTYEPACEGCGTYGDQAMSNVDNLNECPELLDLAHAHGITDTELAGLDRPQTPEPEPRTSRRLFTFPITTSDVPAALRGPHWKPRT